ncbi:MAG: peptidylprolyl isomerase [Actinomycetes bacterium]
MRAFRWALSPLAVVAALVPLTLTACDPVHPGSAAIVGDQAISVDTLQQLTNRVLVAADAQTRPQIAGNADALAKLQRSILTRLIDDELLNAAARQLGVSASEGAIDQEQAQLVQQAGGQQQLSQQAVLSGIAPRELRSALRGLVLGNRLSEAVVANEQVSPTQLQAAYQQNIDQFDQVHAAHILVASKAQADSILAAVQKDPAAFAQLAKQFSTDTASRASGGDLGTVGRSRLDPSFAKAVFAAKPGSIIEVHSSFGWHVVHIIAHPHESLAAATPGLRASILQPLAQQRLNALLDGIARRMHIDVSPRYGQWSNGAVTAPPNDLSKPVATPTPQATLPTGTGQPPTGG